MEVIIRKNVDVTFTLLPPFDKRRKIEVTQHGRFLCPMCSFFTGTYSSHWFKKHLAQQHYKCECGWIGVKPGSHVAKNEKHGGIPSMGKRRKATRFGEL